MIDVAAALTSLVLGVLFLSNQTDLVVTPFTPRQVLADGTLGVLASASLLWWRRWPVPVAVGTALLSVLSAAAFVAPAIAVFVVAVHRRAAVALAVAVLNVACAAGYFLWRPQRDQPFWALLVESAAVVAALVAWGMFVRARRQLVQSLRERADRAEAQQRLQAERARQAERTRIAREMHDVLAHRLSLLVLHAGALEVRPDLEPDAVRRSASLMRGTARAALEDLRGVIGVLRDDSTPELVPQAPQPKLIDVVRLVEESRRAGAKVELRMQVDSPESAPGPLGRDAYRVVQEALTNVNKHATGTATTVDLSGGPGCGLRISVRNRMPVGPPSSTSLPGAGMGLVGLGERVALAGGSLTHGPTAAGLFDVTASMEWPT